VYARRVYSVIKNKDMYYAKYLIDVMMVWGGGEMATGEKSCKGEKGVRGKNEV